MIGRLAVCGWLIAWSADAAAQDLGRQLSPPDGSQRAAVPVVEERVEEEPPPPIASRLDEAPQAPVMARTQGDPPDIVLTRDGGMLRGTIVRSRPGRSVVIRLDTGELEEVAWADVRFAGRAGDAPSETRSRAEPVEDAHGVLVRFESPQRTTLHVETGSASLEAQVDLGFTRIRGRARYYDRGCTAPCELRLEPGFQRLALSIGEREPIPLREIEIPGPGTLTGRVAAGRSSSSGSSAQAVRRLRVRSFGAPTAAIRPSRSRSSPRPV